MQQFFESLNLELWIFPVAVILGVLILNRLGHWLVSLRLRRKKPEQQVWRHAIISALDAPVRVLIWLLGARLIKEKYVPTGTEPMVDRVFALITGILIIFVITWFLLRVVKRIKHNYVARARSRGVAVDQTAVDAVSKLAWAFILIFAVISIMHEVGVPLVSLLAFGGAAGIAVGFAAQTLVANLLGGLTVYASGIFKIGDDIIFPGSDLAGTVQQIGWRATRILGWDGKELYVPNSPFNTSNMVNHSRLEHRTISEYILLHYQDLDKAQAIVREGNELLESREDISYFTFRFDSFGESTLKLYIYAWAINSPQGDFLPYAEFVRIKEEVLLAIVGIARNHGCDLRLPVANIYMREDEGSLRAKGDA